MPRSNGLTHPQYNGIVIESGRGSITCSICQENLQAGERRLTHSDCSNSFHENCLLPWLDRNPSCPLCRGDVRPRDRNRRRPSPPMDAASIREAIREIELASAGRGRSDARTRFTRDRSPESSSDDGFPRYDPRDFEDRPGRNNYAADFDSSSDDDDGFPRYNPRDFGNSFGRHGGGTHVTETRTITSRNGGPRYVTETRTSQNRGGPRHRSRTSYIEDRGHSSDSSDTDDFRDRHRLSTFARHRELRRESAFDRRDSRGPRSSRLDDFDREIDALFSPRRRSRW